MSGRFLGPRLVAATAGAVVLSLWLGSLCLAQDAQRSGDVLLSSYPSGDVMPAVAYNSNPLAQEFLVVWDHWGELVGQIYGHQGVPQGDLFSLQSYSQILRTPEVAYSLAADSYLVVWDQYAGTHHDVWGQLIDADGSLLGSAFVIESGTTMDTHPTLAFDGDRYLVVWESGSGSSHLILGRFVDDDGTVDTALLSIGAGGTAARYSPRVAYNATQDEYLVAYNWVYAGGTQVAGRRVDPSGTVLGSGEYTVDGGPEAGRPSVAAAAWGAYVVVWSDGNILGRVVLAGADLSFDGGRFEISTAPALQDDPAIALAPSTGQFLVVWHDERLASATGRDIYGQRLLPDANLAGTNFVVNDGPGQQHLPALASGQEPDVYLVVWYGGPDQSSDVFGQRVSWTGSLLWYEFVISAQPDMQRVTDVAYNPETGETMAIWSDDASQHLYTRRLSAGGQPLEEPQVVDTEGMDRTPALATDGDVWVEVHRDVYDKAIEYCILYAQGGVVTCVSVPDTGGGMAPDIVYGASIDRFLMAWEQNNAIYGGLHSGGSLTGGPFAISSGSATEWSPSAAWDPDHERFLVVWEEIVDTGYDIVGRLIDGDGSFATASFRISGDGLYADYWDPVAAYNPADDEYLVAYSCSNPQGDICARRVTWAGNVETPGDEFVVWSGASGVGEYDPQLVYVPAAHRYYVLWSDSRNDAETGLDLYGRWLEANGSPASPSLPFFLYAGDQADLSLVLTGGGEQVLAVWSDDRRGTSDVYARFGALDTAPPVARFFHLPWRGRPGTTFVFNARPSSDDLTPQGALAVRWDWTGDGSWDTGWSLDKVITQTVWLPDTYNVTLQVRDLVSSTATTSQTVVVQMDDGNKAPRAALDAAASWALAGVSLTFDTAASDDDETPGALQVRWDWESDGLWDTDWSLTPTATHVYTVAGDHLVRAEVQDAGGLTAAAFFNVTTLPQVPATLSVSPPQATTGPGRTVQFQAAAWDSYGNRMDNPPVTWAVTDPLVGTISAGGLLTAGMEAGSYVDVVLAQSGSAGDSASVTIFWPYRVYLPLVLARAR